MAAITKAITDTQDTEDWCTNLDLAKLDIELTPYCDKRDHRATEVLRLDIVEFELLK